MSSTPLTPEQAENKLWEHIAAFLTPVNRSTKFLAALDSKEDLLGDIPKFLSIIADSLSAETKPPPPAPTLIVASDASPPGDSGGASDAPAARRAPMDAHSLAEVAGLSVEEIARRSEREIRRLVEDVRTPHRREGIARDGSNDSEGSGDGTDAAVRIIQLDLEKQFPTEVFRAKLESHIAEAADGCPTMGSHVGVDAELVFKFLKKNESFNLLTDIVDPSLFAHEKEGSSARSLAAESLAAESLAAESPRAPKHGTEMDSVKTVQRVFKLAPSFEKTSALLSVGVTSALVCRTMGKSRLKAALSDDPAVSNDDIDQIYKRAADQSAAATILAGELYGISTASKLSTLRAVVPVAKMEKVSRDFPNLRILFSTSDSYSYDPSETVYGPAAYLVDVLQFFRHRLLKNSVGGVFTTALDLIKTRRSDICDLDLNTANTSTSLPYIDLVCELLEDATSPPPTYLTNTAPTVGPASGDLVSTIRTNLKVNLSTEARVTTDGAQNYTVRDGVGTVVTFQRTSPTTLSWSVSATRQTFGKEADLAAAPAYLNADAYSAVARSTVLPSLPFNLASQEGRAYLARFGTSKEALTRIFFRGFAPQRDAMIALDALGLSSVEVTLITQDQRNVQDQFWNTGNASSPQTVLENVEVFLSRSGIEYAELLAMLAAKWVNPPGTAATMSIKHAEERADLSTKRILKLDNAALDRFHRFIRLWRAVKQTCPASAAWSIRTLDRALQMAAVGNGVLDEAFLAKIPKLGSILQRLGGRGVRLTADDVLNFFATRLPFDKEVPEARGLATYESVYLSVGRVGKLDDPALAVDAMWVAEVAPAVTSKFTEHAPYLCRCLGVSSAELTAFLDDDLGDISMHFGGLLTLHSKVTLARCLGIRAAELSALRKLLAPATSPFRSPDDMIRFLDGYDTVLSSGMSAADLVYVLRHQAADMEAREPSQAQLEAILGQIQTAYRAEKARLGPAYDESTPLPEGLPGILSSLSLAGATKTEVDNLGCVLAGTVPVSQVLLPAVLSSDAGAETAVEKLKTSDGSEAARASAAAALSASAISKLYLLQKTQVLPPILESAYGLESPLVSTMLTKIPSFSSLYDESIATATPISAAGFPTQVASLRLAYKLSAIVKGLGLSSQTMAWPIDNWYSIGFELAKLPVQPGQPAMPFAAWSLLVQYARLFASSDFADAEDKKAVPAERFTLDGLLSLARQATATLDRLAAYTERLCGWDKSATLLWTSSWTWRTTDFSVPQSLVRLGEAHRMLLRFKSVSAAALYVMGNQSDLGRDHVDTLRQGLRERYSDRDWLPVLRGIQNGLRTQKRDALVAHMLAANKQLSTADDISDFLLIDVMMGPETLTSRIIQAHASVQLLAQRLQMGLETNGIAETDDEREAWRQWPVWMSQYRTWEANRKIFLYPESYIEPELRDNKSEIFAAFESDVQQGQLAEEPLEKATSSYLAALDGIANLDPAACHYATATKTLHVFARTRGGDPVVLYHRELRGERMWTPWEKVEGVQYTGKPLLVFERRGRLSMAWLEISVLSEEKTSVAMPDAVTWNASTKDKPPPEEKLGRRTEIRLAVSTRDPSTRKWSPKRLSLDAVTWPYVRAGSGPFWTEKSIETLIGNLEVALPEDKLSMRYVNLGGDLGDMIVVEAHQPRSALDSGDISRCRFWVLGLGIFRLTGCQGYPEVVSHRWMAKPIHSNDPAFAFQFQGCFFSVKYADQAWTYRPQGGESRPADLEIQQPLEPWSWAASERDLGILLGRTHGSFSVIQDVQLLPVDWANQLWTLYSQVLESEKPHPNPYVRPRPVVTAGMYAPFFFSDSLAGSFVIVPGFYPPDHSYTRTVSDMHGFLSRCIALARVALGWFKGDVAALQTRVKADPEYQALKAEWFKVYHNKAAGYRIGSFYHPLVCSFRQALLDRGFEGLFSRPTQMPPASAKPPFWVRFNPKLEGAGGRVRELPGEGDSGVAFDQRDAYAIYNWELFFHLPLQVAGRLNQDQQFEAADRWYHFIFDPQGSSAALPAAEGVPVQARYWVTKPFVVTDRSDYMAERIDSIFFSLARDPSGGALPDWLRQSVATWRANPYSPHAVARLRPVAYQIATVLKYIKNLVDWGDSLFRQLTREALTRACQLYMLADKLLGPAPRIIPPPAAPEVRSYNSLTPKLDLFSNALTDLENVVPIIAAPGTGPPAPPPPPASVMRGLYFGIPGNDAMLACWDLVADRLAKIRHSQDIDGNTITLPLTAPPLDPAALVKAVAGGALSGGGGPGSLASARLPHHRFWYVTERASALAASVSSLGASLLSMLQQRDAEGLARLRSSLEMGVLRATRSVRVAAIQEAERSIEATRGSREAIDERRAYYTSREYMNAGEATAVVMSGASIIIDIAVEIASLLAGGLKMIPQMSAGCSGFGGSPVFTVTYGGANLGGGAETMASALAGAARLLDKGAAMAATQGSYQRRMDDWQFQGRLAERDLAQVDRQVASAEARRAVAAAELAALEASVDQAARLDEYMRSKYTNQELYEWGIRQVTGVYFDAFKLAYGMARQAEQCYAYELGLYDAAAPSFIGASGYWDGLHSGLLAGELLAQGIRRMEAAYMEKNQREYELVKNVSLEQADPLALITLRATGKCTFEVREALFDMDCPGHYFRRNRSVSVSIPCVTGSYTPVCAKLTLHSHRYRASPRLSASSPSGDPYSEIPSGDPRFVYNVGGETHSIVTSTGISDPGLHATAAGSSRDSADRYRPFEGTGAIASYTLALPTVIRQFDYATIPDVVLHIAYTARDGGSTLRGAVEAAQLDSLNRVMHEGDKGGLFVARSFRAALSNAWFVLRKGGEASVTLGTEQFPYFANAGGIGAEILTTAWFARLREGVVVNEPEMGLVVDGEEGCVVTMRRAGGTGVILQGSPPNEKPSAGVEIGKAFTLQLKKGEEKGSLGLEDVVDLVVLVGYRVRRA